MSKYLSVLLATVLFSTIAFPQSEEDARRLSYLGIGFGARALGLGTAYTGVANDYSAIYWNPAGLAQIEMNELSLGLSHYSFNNEASFLGTKETFSNSNTNLNSFGLVYPFPVYKGSLVFALGYGRQSDFTSALGFSGDNFKSVTVEYPDNIEMMANILENGGINNWMVAGAVEAAKNLYIGLSLNVISGSYSYDRDYTETDIRNNWTLDSYNQYYTIQEDIGGFTARLGLLHQFKNTKGKIGINVKFPTYLSVDEDYTQDQYFYYDNRSLDSSDLYSGRSSFEVTTPFVFSAGLAWTFGPVLVSGSIDYTDWTQMEFKNTYADLLRKNTTIKEDMKATVNFRLGAEVAIPMTDLQLRGGFAYLPSPYRFDSGPNAQRYITGGLGWVVENSVKFDLGYAYGYWDTDHLIEYASPKESVKTHNVVATVSYRF